MRETSVSVIAIRERVNTVIFVLDTDCPNPTLLCSQPPEKRDHGSGTCAGAHARSTQVARRLDRYRAEPAMLNTSAYIATNRSGASEKALVRGVFLWRGSDLSSVDLGIFQRHPGVCAG